MNIVNITQYKYNMQIKYNIFLKNRKTAVQKKFCLVTPEKVVLL